MFAQRTTPLYPALARCFQAGDARTSYRFPQQWNDRFGGRPLWGGRRQSQQRHPWRRAQILRSMPARGVEQQLPRIPSLRVNLLLERAQGQNHRRAVHGRQDEQRTGVTRGMDNARHVQLLIAGVMDGDRTHAAPGPHTTRHGREAEPRLVLRPHRDRTVGMALPTLGNDRREFF